MCILRNLGFSQEYCFRNLEENSIKKGFDGLFLKQNKLWLAESKSTETIKQHNNNHKYTVDLAYNGINKQISGKTNNDPWENAVSHANNAKSEKNLIKKLTQFSKDYSLGKFQSIENHNIILGSTVITDIISDITSDVDSLVKLVENHNANSEILIAINLSNKHLFADFIAKVVANE